MNSELLPRYAALDLDPAAFIACGALAPAAIEAMALALERANESLDQGRVPIAGAVVARAGERIETVTVGNNGRIPSPGPTPEPHDPRGIGYPSDHGETAAIRVAGDISGVDWPNAVFATTLSPCRMCARSIQFLYARGLRHLVIGQSEFEASLDILDEMSELTVVSLTNTVSSRAFQTFARRYPREWDADIGATPAGPNKLAALRDDAAAQDALVDRVRDGEAGTIAAVYGWDADGTGHVHGRARDERDRYGGNPSYAAPMLAFGRAGSRINLRECALVVSADRATMMDRATFGDAALGMCEQFRPGLIIARPTLAPDVARILGERR